MTTCNWSFPRLRAVRQIAIALALAIFGYTAAAQTQPQVTWYTLGASDFNPSNGQTQTLGIQVFLHSNDSRVVAFRATTAVLLGAGLGAPAAQGTATNVLDGTDATVYIPVTPYTATASLQTQWILVELFLSDGTTFSSVERLPAPFQQYSITLAATSAIPISRAGVRR